MKQEREHASLLGHVWCDLMTRQSHHYQLMATSLSHEAGKWRDQCVEGNMSRNNKNSVKLN